MAVTLLHCAHGMQALDTETVKDYLAQREQLAAHLGPSDTKSDWQVCPSPPACCPFCSYCWPAWHPRRPFVIGSKVLHIKYMHRACMRSAKPVSGQCSSAQDIVVGGGGRGGGRGVSWEMHARATQHRLPFCCMQRCHSKNQPR